MQIAAIKELLDRGYGKAAQVLAADEERPLAIRFEWAPASDQQPDGLTAPTIAGDTGTLASAPFVIEWESPESC